LKKLDEYTEIRKNNFKYYMKNSPIIPFLKGDENNFFRIPILLNSEEEKNRLINL
jgi:dTDP-4-amino-4,6-dideoxygalactose transaminase